MEKTSKGRLPFNAWSRGRIEAGIKVFTSRKQRYEEDPRVVYISPPLQWWFIRTYLWQGEGADSPEELQRVINKIFRRIVADHETFYVHVLRPYGDTEQKG